jgi:outer membrane biosynthesis protein TonB
MASKNKKTLALRIGIIQSGRLIEEFIVKDDKPVTLGSTIKSSIIVSNKKIPNKYKLFATKNGSATLYLSDSMEAEISDGDNKKEYRSQSISISLSNKDRGKVKVDDNIKILFQFIEPPEEFFIPHKIPPQFRNKPTDYMDFKFLIPLVISMILHIVWVVALQTMEYDESILTMDQIPDRFKEVIIENKPIEEVKKVEIKVEDKGDKGEDVKKGIAKKEVKEDKVVKVEKTSMTKSERKAIAQESVKKKSKVLSALHQLKSSGGGFGAINDTAGGGNGNEADVSLSDIAANSKGSGSGYGSGSGDSIGGRGTGVGVTGGSGYSRKSGTNKGGPTSLNTDIGNNRKELDTKKVKKVAIKTKSKITTNIKNDGNLNEKSATQAIKKAKKKVDGCYQTEAKKNNAFSGRVTILITVGAGGNPMNVEILSTRMNDNNLAKSLGKCIKQKLKRIKFPAPANPPINIKFTAAFSAGG